jgi:hypothetical protein
MEVFMHPLIAIELVGIIEREIARQAQPTELRRRRRFRGWTPRLAFWHHRRPAHA